MEDTSLGVKIPGANSDGSYNSGMYKVGKDIKAGTYTITPDGSGKSYYAVYKNSTDATNSARIAETRITKATNVAVSDGEYIWFYRASMKYCQNPNSGLDFDATAASE